MLITIIIPVHNSAKFLHRCINSVITQTYPNWELILIDDGSEDESSKICDEYTQIDRRIKVIHTENGGVSRSRNIGLENALGDFVTFSDSDDEILPCALEYYTKAVGVGVDVVRGGFERVKIENTTIISTASFVTSDKEKILHTCAETRYEAYVWNSFFRKELIGNIRFDESISWCEDHLFTFSVMSKARKVAFISELVYRYYAPDTNAISMGGNLSSRYIDPKMVIVEALEERRIKTAYLSTPLSKENELIDSEFNYKVRLALRYAIIGNRYKEALAISCKYLYFDFKPLILNILYIKISPCIRRLVKNIIK